MATEKGKSTEPIDSSSSSDDHDSIEEQSSNKRQKVEEDEKSEESDHMEVPEEEGKSEESDNVEVPEEEEEKSEESDHMEVPEEEEEEESDELDDEESEEIVHVEVPEEEEDELDDEDEFNKEELSFFLEGEELELIKQHKEKLEADKEVNQIQLPSPTKPLPILFIHHSEGELFEQRAQEAKQLLEEKNPGITVILNRREKSPRLGVFYIRSEEGEEFITLRMEPPFKELMDLDMDYRVWEISVLIKNR